MISINIYRSSPPVLKNDMVILIGLRHGICEASLGADNNPRYLVARLRAAGPDVHIHVRGDSGFGVPRMYIICRELRLSYTFGIGMNSRLLKETVEEYDRTGQLQRRFLATRTGR
jgi:hypothetical protein